MDSGVTKEGGGGRTAPGDTIQGGDTIMKVNFFAAEFTRTLDKRSLGRRRVCEW